MTRLRILGAILTSAVRTALNLWRITMTPNFLNKLTPYLAGLGASLINLDENNQGPDDIAGAALLYAADVIAAVDGGADQLPPLPDILLQPVQGKLSGAARTTIVLATGPIQIARFQLLSSKPRLSRALGYIGDVLTALAASKPVPPVPASLR